MDEAELTKALDRDDSYRVIRTLAETNAGKTELVRGPGAGLLVRKYVPDDRLLIETDSPYLAPIPLRGQTNEPAFVVHTARFLADLRQVPAERLAAQTFANAVSLFG